MRKRTKCHFTGKGENKIFASKFVYINLPNMYISILIFSTLFLHARMNERRAFFRLLAFIHLYCMTLLRSRPRYHRVCMYASRVWYTVYTACRVISIATERARQQQNENKLLSNGNFLVYRVKITLFVKFLFICILLLT